MRLMDSTVEKIRDIIKNGSNIVVMSGLEVIREAGLNGVKAEHIAYDIEAEYGYSADEIVSTSFFARRSDAFFKFYKDIILNRMDAKPTKVHEGIAKLEKLGKLKTIISRMVYSLYEEAGCSRIIKLHGSVEENVCPSCGKMFGSRYIKESKGTPKCDVCDVILRPGFPLRGEMVDNGRMSKACDAVEGADILMIIGAPVNSTLCRYMVKYYKGDKMVLINTEVTPGDERADYRMYGNLSEIFEKVMDF